MQKVRFIIRGLRLISESVALSIFKVDLINVIMLYELLHTPADHDVVVVVLCVCAKS